jgi:hypothetical protein
LAVKLLAMMAFPTLVISFLLILVGVGGYLLGHPDPVTHHVGPTALIPAAVGVVLGVLGAISFCDKARKHAMHVAAMVGLLAGLGDAVQLVQHHDGPGGAAVETHLDVGDARLVCGFSGAVHSLVHPGAKEPAGGKMMAGGEFSRESFLAPAFRLPFGPIALT